MKIPFFEKSKKNIGKSNCAQVSLQNVKEQLLTSKLNHMGTYIGDSEIGGHRYIGDNWL
jgi:hypothetical protein